MQRKLKTEIKEKDSIEARLEDLKEKKKKYEDNKLGHKELVLISKEERRLNDIKNKQNELEKIRNENYRSQAEAKRKYES